MAGFFGRLFNRNNDKKKEDSYFLDPDSSKTVGDIDYMRKSATVRRTFPKTKTGGGGDILIDVSSMDKRAIKNESVPETPKTTTPKVSERRTAKDSSGMDMFRNMAKEIRKS